MARKLISLVLVVAAFSIAAAALPGCMDQREAVDRVQPLALKKTWFVGEDLVDPADNPEFFAQGTLVDVGFGADQEGLFTASWAQPVSRVKFQITEDLLLGRLAYERVAGSDGKGVGKAVNDGIIAVAYKIEKHFDIVRAYNETTGEELNIIEENDEDRPWYERSYMRVDWSKNLNVDSYDYDTLSMIGVDGGVKYEPLAYDVTDPQDPFAPEFDLENGYFDVTNKAFAKPLMVDLRGLDWGIDEFPACWLEADFFGGSYPSGSCSPIEITIRQAFRKVVDTDYEPVHWDGLRFQAFGGFTVDRHGFTRNYGMSDDKWHRFLSRYQIWERAHYYKDPVAMTGPVECFTPETTPYGADPHRDQDENGTEDECELVGYGSRCDEFRQRCTLPYADRETITIPWYFTNGSLHDVYEASAQATHEWDVALRASARAAQYAECQHIGGENCALSFPVFFGQIDEGWDAIVLAREVDACRAGRVYQGEDCDALADRLGSERGYSAGVVSIAKMKEMIVLCHSPVQDADHPACGGPRLPPDLSAADCALARKDGDRSLMTECSQALNVRRGDMRYHQINAIEEPQIYAPWGIYSDTEDPLSGQAIAASINVWTFISDYYTQGLIDRIRYIKGELATEDVTEGEYVRKWVEAARAASGNGVLPKMTRAQLQERLDRFSFRDGRAGEQHGHDHGQEPAGLDPVLRTQVRQLNRKIKGVRASAKAPSAVRAKFAARRQRARGSEFEAKLMTPMMQMLQGVVGLPLNDGLMEIASPLRGGHPGWRQELKRLKGQALAERGACILHPREALAPISLLGLADELERKFGNFNPGDPPDVQQERAERMRAFLSRRLHYSALVHEMGHSLGMRHNFVSSADAWQYRPQYWQLRTKNGQVTTPCTELTQDGTTCVGPRYFDPVTQEEQDNLIWMFMQSSVMEYPGEPTQDFMGLGVFDFASMRMFYGDVATLNDDPSFAAGTPLGTSMIGKMDNFGGILGIEHYVGDSFVHYSQLNEAYQGLIRDCQVIDDPQQYRPADWDEERSGTWSPVIDGLFVQVDGQWTRCRQQPVDYMPWSQLRMPTEAEGGGEFYWGGPAVAPDGRTRMPYGFGTDSWADLGNVSVYTHDNGADAYEIFNFLVTQDEVNHIFDNYRRHRMDFSVRYAADRSLWRYNMKLRDGAKGMALYKNIYEFWAEEVGYDFDTLWPHIALEFSDNVLASSLVFDHFARQMARPEVGPHFFAQSDPVLRSAFDVWDEPGPTSVVVPNGATGYFGNIGLGGRLVENQLATGQGEYDSEYVINAGSYYDKINAAYLMTESVDYYISATRTDFIDPRYRAISLADMFPEGYRRWLANNLTGDDGLKGARLAADAAGDPLVDVDGFPAAPIGWTSWWGDEPSVCFAAEETTVCSHYAAVTGDPFHPQAPQNVAVLDPQVGWEQQKFLIAWTMLYLPENEQQWWIDRLRMWELGVDADPGFANRIEFHNPTGRVYVAKTFGKEVLFGKQVHKGIAARVLEYANGLMAQAYETTDGPDVDGDGQPDWYLPVLEAGTGEPIVRWDPSVTLVDEDGFLAPDGLPGCDATDNSLCTCSVNRACIELKQYVSVPSYMREAIDAYWLGDPEMRGVY